GDRRALQHTATVLAVQELPVAATVAMRQQCISLLLLALAVEGWRRGTGRLEMKASAPMKEEREII
ncbi:Hypothetical predicted protein, partial [Olea europaea subsp. europaea]